MVLLMSTMKYMTANTQCVKCTIGWMYGYVSFY